MGKAFNQDDVKELKVSEPFRISENKAIIIKKIKFKGDKEYIDIRQHYMDDAGHYKATPKGLWVPVSDIDDADLAIDVFEKAIEFAKEK